MALIVIQICRRFRGAPVLRRLGCSLGRDSRPVKDVLEEGERSPDDARDGVLGIHWLGFGFVVLGSEVLMSRTGLELCLPAM
jgi:hypothetical protein